MHKGLHIKSHFITTDAPDITLINTGLTTDRIKIEVYEAYVHGANNSVRKAINVPEEVEKLWQSKGLIDYGQRASILVTIPNRKATINLSEFAREVAKRKWFVEKIYLHTYLAAENRHYYHIVDVKDPTSIKRIDFSQTTDSKYYY